MEYRDLGVSGIKISEIGLGCWTIGGPCFDENGYPNGWGHTNDNEAVRAIREAIDEGVNHFDTADVYGNGRSERILAEALQGYSDKVIVASKVGYIKGSSIHPYEPANIRSQCELSLKNIRRDYIDIYYFHHANFGPNDCWLNSALEQMERLKEEGKIRLIGLSAYTLKDFVRLVPKIKPSVVQAWAHIMDDHFISSGSALMRLCESYGMGFIAFSPLNQGILLGKYSSTQPLRFTEGDHRSRSSKFSHRYLRKAENGLEKIKKRFGSDVKTLARIALQYVLYHKNVSGVIPGFRNTNHVKINTSVSGWSLNGEEIAYIRKCFR